MAEQKKKGLLAGWGDRVSQLGSDPIFNIGMGLLQHRANKETSIAQGILGGIKNAKDAKLAEEEEARMEEARIKAQALMAGQAPPTMPQPGTTMPGLEQPAGAMVPQPIDPTGMAQPPAGAMAPQQPAAPGAPPPASEFRSMGGQIGVQGPQAAGATPGFAPPAAMGQQGTPSVEQALGIMAGVDPVKAMQQYGQHRTYMDRTQLMQQAKNTPAEKWLRMYGNVNPHDFTPGSMSDFHDNLTKTGQPDFSKLVRNDDLSTKEQGLLSESINKAQTAEISLGRMQSLATRFDEMHASGDGYTGRLAGGVNEWLKGVLGDEDAVTALRTEYNQVKNKLVVEGLPAGVASDKDIEIAMSGWPSGVSDPEYIASFLRGMSKIQAIEHAQATHGAQYLSRHQNQKGQLDDWSVNRGDLIQKSIDRLAIPGPVGGNRPAPASASTKKLQTLKDKYGIE